MTKQVTSFSGGNENPISEGGTWLNGLLDCGNNQNIKIDSGHAVGTVTNPTNYDDNIACRLPIYGADQWSQATVYRAAGYNPTTVHEGELWLGQSMSTASGGTMRGYEMMFNSAGSGDIGFWAGPGWPSSPPDPFAFVSTSGPGMTGSPVANGDVMRAEKHWIPALSSNLLMLFQNGKPVLWGFDANIVSGGAPGMGFFTRGGDAVLTSLGFDDHIASDENFPVGLTNTGSVSQAAASSISIPMLVASGTIAPTVNNSLVIGVLSASASNTVNAPTWAAGSGAVTKLGEATGSGGAKISIWQIQNPNPTTGSTTQNVTVTASGASLTQAFCWLVCNSDITVALTNADTVTSTAVTSPIALTASNLTSSDMSIAVAGVVSTGSLTGLTPNQDYDHDDGVISYMEAAHSFGTGGFSLTNTGVSANNQAFVVVRIKAIPAPTYFETVGPATKAIGLFDEDMRSESWFDPDLNILAWFDEDMVQSIPAANGTGGASAAVAQATAQALAMNNKAGASTGSGQASGAVVALNLQAGASTGTGQAAGAVVALNKQTGASQGLAPAAAVATALFTVNGSSAGLGQAAGAVVALSSQAGASTGLGQSSAAVVALSTQTGASTGLGQAAADGTALNTQTGASQALGQASAVDASTSGGGTIITVNGESAGFGQASAQALSTATVSGESAGLAQSSAQANYAYAVNAVSAAVGQASAFADFLFLVTGASQALGQASGQGQAATSHTISPARADLLYQIALLHGLDPAYPLTVTPASQVAGALTQAMTGTDPVTIHTAAAPPLSGDLDSWIDKLAEWYGLSADATVTPISRVAGSVNQTLTGDATTTRTVTSA